MERTNEAWRAHLGGEGPQQQMALVDLRRVLLRGLRAALSGRGPFDGAFFEDTVQDALLRILDCLPQFEGRSRFETWAVSIAVRLAFSELRRKRWKDISLDTLLGDDAFDPPALPSHEHHPVADLEQQALVEAMYEVIRRDLTERQRTALRAELREIPQDEIARHLNSNRNAVYKLTHDARKALKRGLEAAGYRVDNVWTAFVS